MCYLVARELLKVAAPYFLIYLHSSAVVRRLGNLAYVGLSGLLSRVIVPTV